MLLMTVLIPTFPPKSRHNTNDGAFFRQFWDMGAKDKATGKSRSDVQQRIQQFHSQEFLNSLRGTTQFAGTDYRSKDLTPKNPGCWLTRFLRFISMATRADSKWIYHNPLIVRTAKTRSARSRQQTGKNGNKPPEKLPRSRLINFNRMNTYATRGYRPHYPHLIH